MINFDILKIDENKVNIKNDKVEKENNDQKEKELNEKQQKELEMKKKLEEEEKKKNEVNQKLLKEKEDKKRKEQLKIQKKQFENDKLKQEKFLMPTPPPFVCSCTNLMILQQYIYEGTDCAEIPLMLKNEGAFVWPKNFTKLVFEKKYNIKGKDVELNGLEPGQEEQYIAKIEGLGNLPVGEYETGVYFNIKGRNCGNMMKIKIFIIQKQKDVDPKIKYKNEIQRFRDEYEIKKEEFSDDEIYDLLKSNDFDLEKAFKCLAGEI